jgi:hypothetical protein
VAVCLALEKPTPMPPPSQLTADGGDA